MGGGGTSPCFTITSHGLQMLQSEICFDFVLSFTHMLAHANASSVFHLSLNIDC